MLEVTQSTVHWVKLRGLYFKEKFNKTMFEARNTKLSCFQAYFQFWNVRGCQLLRKYTEMAFLVSSQTKCAASIYTQQQLGWNFTCLFCAPFNELNSVATYSFGISLRVDEILWIASDIYASWRIETLNWISSLRLARCHSILSALWLDPTFSLNNLWPNPAGRPPTKLAQCGWASDFSCLNIRKTESSQFFLTKLIWAITKYIWCK